MAGTGKSIHSRRILMLVLSRKPGERIVVPNCELAVTIVAVEGNNVRLGISAPDNIAVYREEVWLQIGPQKQRSSAKNREVTEGSGMTDREARGTCSRKFPLPSTLGNNKEASYHRQIS
jgi:carbon storage regulator